MSDEYPGSERHFAPYAEPWPPIPKGAVAVDPIDLAKIDFDEAVRKFADEMDQLGFWMPDLADYVRLHADDLAEKYKV